MIQALRRALRGFASLALIAALPGCEVEPPEPPDPSEPTPVVTCDDGGPLTLTRTTADTALPRAPWVEVCTLCPVQGISVGLSDADAEPLPAVSAWARGAECAVAMPTVPLPESGVIDAAYGVDDGARSGEVTVEVTVGGERGEDPPDLDGATFVLEWDVARGRHPFQGDPRFFDPAPGPSMLIAFGAPDAAGLRAVTVGLTDATGDAQDLCVPTRTVGSASILSRQVGGELVAGAELLQPTPIPLARGALQGRLNEGGSGLFDVTLLGVVDIVDMEPIVGPPEDFCGYLSTQAEPPPCVPCTDPAVGVDEDRHCFTAVWEWAGAARADQPLQPVDAEALPPECSED